MTINNSHRNFAAPEIPFSQLSRRLTSQEEDGTLAREIGIVPQRSHQVSRQDMDALTPASVRYVYIDRIVPMAPHRYPSAASQPFQTA